MALYMLYRSKSNSREEMDDLREKFQKIYDKHNVNIVGFWVNAEDEDEVFYLSKYKDENDYKKKVESLHSDEEYVRLSKKLKEVRTSIESTKLLPMMAEA
ncbi:MAG: NIPSNAP family protein [Candidatus Thorarchaeota archaeon]